jgi:predicted transcriptional regulator
MTSPVTTADPDADVLDAVHTMRTQQITRMPVMGRYRMIGIVSASDLAFALNRPLQDLLQGAGGRRHKY